MKHRPIGLGLMGFQDALYKVDVSYASDQAVEFADQTMEAISYFAISASTNLAAERGAYASYEGSLWSQGVFPIDSLAMLVEQRGADYISVNQDSTMDWDALRETVSQQGMRNSNVMAIAPTATIANITGGVAIDRADLSESIRQVESLGRIHCREPLPRARP